MNRRDRAISRVIGNVNDEIGAIVKTINSIVGEINVSVFSANLDNFILAWLGS